MRSLNGRFPQNGHPVHDLKALFRAGGLPEHLKEASTVSDGVVGAPVTDIILSDLGIIQKSMDLTGVGEEVRGALEALDAI